MASAIKAVYEDGVFKPIEPVALEEHTQVGVRVAATARDPDDPTGWKAIDRLIGISDDEGGPTDVSENHDECLYGSQRPEVRSRLQWSRGDAMTTAVKAIYEDGVFKPTERVQLEERAEVEVLVPTANPATDDPTGWKAMREFIGLAKDAEAGTASVGHDAIIYRR